MLDIHEKCGLFGVFGKTPDAARTTYYGLFGLQHRGQEGSGIVASNGEEMKCVTGEGLVTHVYTEESFAYLDDAHLAIGHNRYGTSFGKRPAAYYLQPVFFNDEFALAHNGNIPSLGKLIAFLHNHQVSIEDKNDSQLVYEAMVCLLKENLSVKEALERVITMFEGAYSFLMMTKDTLYAFRDENGIRPLSIGMYADGSYVVSSETCAINTVQAYLMRDVRPGELVEISKAGLKSHQLRKPKLHLDAFEFVYFARPDSYLYGKRVHEVRRGFGERLGRLMQHEADIVVPVPDSAVPAAEGIAEVTGIAYRHAMIKNRYIGRTFITPGENLRGSMAEMKYNLIEELVARKKVILVDDSIVRLNTLPRLVKNFVEAGALEVHIAVASPPVIFPDFYGIDLADQEQLVAAWMDVDELCARIGATSLTYLPYREMVEVIGVPEEQLYTGCFTGEYPTEIGDAKRDLRYDIKNIPIK